MAKNVFCEVTMAFDLDHEFIESKWTFVPNMKKCVPRLYIRAETINQSISQSTEKRISNYFDFH